MTRKVILTAVAAILSLSLAAGCIRISDNSSGSIKTDPVNTPSSADSSETDADIYMLDQGSFIIPDSWDEYEPQSTESKIFFVPEDYDGVGVPDNISVEYGRNRYSKEDSTAFGKAITAQILQQAGELLNDGISASGIISDKEEPVLVFSFSIEGVQITQYYICGDYEHIFIYETNFSGSSECDEAAKTIMNSFEWTERD